MTVTYYCDHQEGPADEQRGEAHSTDADELIAAIDNETRVGDIQNLLASWYDQIEAMSEADRARVTAAEVEKCQLIRAGA